MHEIAPGARPHRLATGLACLGIVGLAAACGDVATQVDEADVSAIRVSPDSTAVGLGSTLTLRAYPLDETGAFLAGVEVSWSSLDPGVASVDDGGIVSGLTLGTAEVVATVGTLQASAIVTVLTPAEITLAPDSLLFTVTAGGPAPPGQSVALTNAGEVPLTELALDSIVYVGSASGWALPTLAGSTAPTDLSVEVDPTGVTTAGEYRALVSVSGAEDGPSVLTVVLTVEAGSPVALSINDGDSQAGPVDLPVVVRPSVVVSDSFGNPVAGDSVTFAVTQGGGSATGTTVGSDASGVARVGSWTLGTAVGENRLQASIASGATVTFVATATAGGPASLALNAGDGQTAVAGQPVVVAPSVSVQDAFGNLAVGSMVSFTVTSGGGAISGSPATVDASGIASVGSWTLGPLVGANTLIATAIGAADTVTFTASSVAGAAAQLGPASGDAQSDTVGATLATPYAVLVTDANGNPVGGVTVSWTVTSGGGSIGALSTSDASGIATATHTLGPTAGPQTVEAAVAGLTGSPVGFSSTATAGAPSTLSVAAGDGQSAPVGSNVPVAPAVLVSDASGNPVAAASVAFNVVSGGGSATGSPAVSDALGVATVGAWTLGQAAGPNVLRAVIAGVDSVEFTATGTPGSPASMALEAGDGQSAIAGSDVPIPPSVRVTDAFGNGVDGASVTFVVLGGGGSVTGATALTIGGGVGAVGSWTLGSAAGANTLRATSPGVPDTVTFTATSLPGAASEMLYVAGDAQTDTVGATLATAYSVRIVDDVGNGVAGIPVSWSVGVGGSITPSSTSDANGFAVAMRVLGTAVGPDSAFASVGGLTGSPVRFTSTTTVGAPASVVVTSGDGQTATVGTTVPIDPAVQVTDQFGNPVAGVGVSFTVTGGGGSVTGSTPTTAADGSASVGSWTLGVAAGANQLSATVTGLAPATFSATGTADAPSQLLLAAGDGQAAVAGTPVAIQPAVRVADQYGNDVAGTTVTFAVTSGGGAVTGASPVSGSSGLATVGSWTLGPSVGSNTLEATAVGIVGSVGFTANGTVGAPATIALAGGDAQSDTVGATLATSYTVLVEDANGNPVSGVTVTWGATGGSITPSSDTDGSGIASAVRVLGTAAGLQAATASVGGLAGSPVGFTATATAGAAAQITVSAGNGQSATVGTAVSTNPAVAVQDQFGNAVAGESVTFAVPLGDGTVSPVTPVLTDASGVATATSWTLGTLAGPDSLTATAASPGISGNPVTLTATATAGAPVSIAVSSGDNQTAITGVMVASQPTVTVTDQFGNAVSGATVDFSASGSGSVGNASVVTGGAGTAATSWTVDVNGGAGGLTDGTFPNTLTATIDGTAISTAFSGFAIYSYQTHVDRMWVDNSCTGCHGGTSNLFLDGTPAQNYAELVNVVPFCDAGLGASVRLVSTLGGSNAADLFSLLYDYAVGDIPQGNCSGDFMRLATADQAILRAWIQNGAPNN